MKTLIYFLVALTALPVIAAVYYVAKQVEYVPNINAVSLLVDITDKQIAEADAGSIFSFYGFSESPMNGAEFHFGNLSDISYDRRLEVKLSPQNFSHYNEIQRKKEIINFKQSLSEIIAKESQRSVGRKTSSLYLPIARELNRLAGSNAKRRVLLVFSDLFENTDGLSFYRKKDFALLRNDSEQVRKYFQRLEPLRDLSGIEIYFVYAPPDPESDKMFSEVSEFYKKFLEEKGAKVNISANLNP